MRILVIEDEPDLLDALGMALGESGYAVDVAADGITGLAKATAGQYDGIVLDVMLPGMNGFEVLRSLRRSDTTPVLMLTARDAVADRVEGLDSGADDYLAKPFELTEFLARVRALVRRGAGGAVTVAGMGEVTGRALAGTLAGLDAARRIQRRLAPAELPTVPGVDLAVHYQPAQWVGGDYCDAWVLADGRLAFAVADVAGKGMPAALVMASLHAALRASMTFCKDAAGAVDYVNRHLAEHLPDELFVSLFLGLLDARTGVLEYVNAGHVPPLLLTPEGSVTPLPPPANSVLGIGIEAYVSEAITLPPGAGLIAVTDGITESTSPSGELFTLTRAAAAARNAGPTMPAARLVTILTDSATQFRGAGGPQDDVTVLAVRRATGATAPT